ncbi:MAG: cyclic nucleotide-binding domain-containing protein [Kofleriaceae bacterium]|nr:cyclic nucleotide-binding domain-containing protein [Myxococcales bacterium]MCB9559775.1 cyclic nucleotide-binding domain-containing protein [Kofleriaceae bacterium]
MAPPCCSVADLRALILGTFDDPGLAVLAAHLERVEVAAGSVVVAEGDVDRALYFVLAGEARFLRGDLQVGRVAAGGWFGELALILGRPRAATVEATAPLTLARLDRPAYERLRDAEPALALRLVETLLAGVADRLVDMTTSVGVLLRDRSFPRRIDVPVRLRGGITVVRTGTPLGELLPARIDGKLVVGGLIDRRATSLRWPITSTCSIEPLTTAHPEGERLLRRSAALLMLEAAARLDPPVTLRMGHSVGVGQRVEVAGVEGSLATLAARLEDGMRALTEAATPLHEEWWTVDEAREHLRERGWTDAADLLDTWHERTVPLCSFGRVQALALGPLVASAAAITGFRVLGDGGGAMVLTYPEEARPARPDGVTETLADIVSQNRALVDPTDRWLATLGVESVGAFNRACVSGRITTLIRVAEGFHEKRVSQVADAILARGRGARVVGIAGPSSSGKTTFIQRLEVQLQVVGLEPVRISLDDYYVDRDASPRADNGDHDYEALEALRLDLLGDHVARLLAGEEVQTAHYDFRAGVSHPTGGPRLRLRDDQVLMLEGIHALNPAMLPALPRDQSFSVFVCPLAQLPFDRLWRVMASDVRLIRRIVRDRHGRNHDAAATIRRWPSVRDGERRHIFPFQHRADAVVDTSLVYELSVLKVYAQRYLLEVPRDDPAWTTAARLLQLLDRFVTIYPEHVPPTSILREFIGG